MAASTYPHPLRLRHKPDFQRVLRDGLVYPGRECLVRILETDLGHPRLGIATPRRFGKAVRRNRFRRLVREAFRRLQQELGSRDVMVSPRKSLEEPTLAGLLADLRRAPAAARPQKQRGGARGRRGGKA
jgi:ribonuclease P protein component